MMIHGIGLLLISSALGYWVLTQSEKEKGKVKKLGSWLGLIIIVTSLAGVACKVYYCIAACQAGGMMSGKACPFPFSKGPSSQPR